LQETYHAVKALEILERSDVESQKICEAVVKSSPISVEDAFYVVKITEVLQCPQGAEVAKVCVLSHASQRGSSTDKKTRSCAHHAFGFEGCGSHFTSWCGECKLSS
jgi:hypothetical protein